MPQPYNHVDLIVVVSGRPEPVRVNPKQKISQLVREALNQTGNHGQPPESWELRTATHYARLMRDQQNRHPRVTASA